MAALPEGGVVGGQDCHAQASGACTGSVSAPLLADAVARLVIVGHSERRENFGVSDADVNAQAEAGLAAGLSVILRVGAPRPVSDLGAAIDLVPAPLLIVTRPCRDSVCPYLEIPA